MRSTATSTVKVSDVLVIRAPCVGASVECVRWLYGPRSGAAGQQNPAASDCHMLVAPNRVRDAWQYVQRVVKVVDIGAPGPWARGAGPPPAYVLQRAVRTSGLPHPRTGAATRSRCRPSDTRLEEQGGGRHHVTAVGLRETVGPQD